MKVSAKQSFLAEIALTKDETLWLKNFIQNLPNEEKELENHCKYRKELYDALCQALSE